MILTQMGTPQHEESLVAGLEPATSGYELDSAAIALTSRKNGVVLRQQLSATPQCGKSTWLRTKRWGVQLSPGVPLSLYRRMFLRFSRLSTVAYLALLYRSTVATDQR